jgi:hypothetical protein
MVEGRHDVVTLWRPVGPVELELIRKAGMKAFPLAFLTNQFSIQSSRKTMR